MQQYCRVLSKGTGWQRRPGLPVAACFVSIACQPVPSCRSRQLPQHTTLTAADSTYSAQGVRIDVVFPQVQESQAAVRRNVLHGAALAGAIGKAVGLFQPVSCSTLVHYFRAGPNVPASMLQRTTPFTTRRVRPPPCRLLSGGRKCWYSCAADLALAWP